MESIIFQMYGTFLLTLVGFVLPIITIALSAFPEGVKSLRETYGNQQKQMDRNLSDELEKQKSEKGIDYATLSKNIRLLKSAKEKAERRLLYLNPNYILSKSLISIGVSLLLFLSGLVLYNLLFYISIILFFISIISLIWAIIIFKNSIEIIIEASSTVQMIRRTGEEKIAELLATLVENTKKDTPSLFIEHKDIKVSFDKKELVPEENYTFSVNKKYKIGISFINKSEYMLKTTELGFTFPREFLVEGSPSSIYTGEKEKIIRFIHDYIQSRSEIIENAIEVTFLKAGEFKVTAFIKGENLKRKTIKFTIKVIE